MDWFKIGLHYGIWIVLMVMACLIFVLTGITLIPILGIWVGLFFFTVAAYCLYDTGKSITKVIKLIDK
jgi:hypothetical protein